MTRLTKKARHRKRTGLRKKNTKTGRKRQQHRTKAKRAKKSRKRVTRRRKGGYANIKTFVGAPYGPELNQLPGVSGAHSGNYYELNKYDVQPTRVPIDEGTSTNSLVGGRKTKRSMKVRQKGGLMGLNVFSQLQTDVVNGYRSIMGETSTPNPLPFIKQLFHGDRSEDNLNYLKVKIT